jgi:DnaD/phage-associated family protein
VGSGPAADTLYFVNGPNEKEALERIKRGEVKLEGILPVEFPSDAPPLKPDIFTLYESNIGQLTPMIAEELKDALVTYPADWIAEAIKIAVTENKRNWHYVSRILERWTAEGKKDGAYKQNPQAAEQDKYVRGRYGPLIQR